MNFSINSTQENDLSLLRLQDNTTGAMVAILPAYGALLHAFEIPFQGKKLNIIDNYSGKEDIEKDLTLSYKSAKLSPFVCRIPGGKYHLDNKEYEFKQKFPDGSAIHGLLANKPFGMLSQSADDKMATASFRYHYKREDPGYPWDYVCEVRYTLHAGRVLQVETTLLNLDDEAIPLADGWHPYFTLGDTVDDYQLQFSSDTMLEFNEKLIPTGNLLRNDTYQQPASLRGQSLDNCFLLEIQEGTPCCVLHNPNNKLTLSLFTNARYPYLQIYTPTHRKSIAIENLSGAPDCFNNGMGVLLLEARHSVTFNVYYQLSVE
jgi:aldose 1-epimerase